MHGPPRSGTTWLGHLINSSPNVSHKFQPLFSYEFKDFLDENSTLSDINNFFGKLYNTNSQFLDQKDDIARGIIPDFKKGDITHISYKEVRYHHILENMLNVDPDLKIIGIIRNPLATIDSWLRAPKEFRKDLGWSELEEWRSGKKKNDNKPEAFYGFEKWKEVANLFDKLNLEYPNNFLLLNYKDLLHDLGNEIVRLFDFCDLEITQQTTDFIHKSRNTQNSDTYSVYKSKNTDDKWSDTLNKTIVQEIKKDLKDTALERYL